MTRRLPVGLTIATTIALAILVGLGVWQLQRLAWKRDLLARMEASQTAPGQPLARVLSEGAAGEEIALPVQALELPGSQGQEDRQGDGGRDGQPDREPPAAVSRHGALRRPCS